MYAGGTDEINYDQFHELVYAVYKLAMDYYPEGPQSCRYIFTTIKAVVDSAVSITHLIRIFECRKQFNIYVKRCLQFHKKTVLKTTYLTNWIMQNCPRLILLLHRYIVHILSTGYRSISEKPQTEPSVSISFFL